MCAESNQPCARVKSVSLAKLIGLVGADHGGNKKICVGRGHGGHKGAPNIFIFVAGVLEGHESGL
jgi:hypothetical protein